MVTKSDAAQTRPGSFDAELALARRGNREAIDRLLARIQSRMRQVARARIGERLLKRVRRSDVLQNTWLDVIQGLPDFTGKTEGEFVAWVVAILENNIRRQGRFFAARKRAAPERTSEMRRFAESLLKPQPSPSAEAVRGEELVLVGRALDALPEEQREIIVLSVIEGLPHRQIAERLGRSEGATRMLLCRARAALSVAIEKLEQR